MTQARKKAYLTGRPRDGGDGRKPWRVRAYAPSPGFPRGRVVWKDTTTGKPATRTPREHETLADVFDEVERGLGRAVALGGRASSRERNLWALAERHYANLAADGRDPDYIYGRRILLEKYFLRQHGDKPVTSWTPALSRKVREFAQANVGALRVEDLGTALSGLRKVAHEPAEGGRWLSPDINPLEGVSFSKGSPRNTKKKNPDDDYIEREFRPDTEAVLCAIEATRRRMARFSEQVGVPELVELSGFAGLRLSEALGVRDVDLVEATGEVHVNGVWLHPRGMLPRRRPETKTGVNRKVPLPASLFDKLLALREPARARVPRRAELAGAALERGDVFTETPQGKEPVDTLVGEWMAEQNHAFLFCDARTGWPWQQETFNTEWHRITRATQALAAERPGEWKPWPKGVPYMNLRHHTATWWNEELELDWPLIARFLGNSYETCLSHYVRTSRGSVENARQLLAER